MATNKTASPTARDSLARVTRDIVGCERCPRLRAWCREVAAKKRRAYLDWHYWGRPVPGFGDRQAWLWILGLAPAAHGANRTGRMFTGDSSGDWLYGALHQTGFASQPTSISRRDGQKVQEAWISSAVRCAPPDNKPLPVEIDRCAAYLDRELVVLRRVRVVLVLGQIAHRSALQLLARQGWDVPRPRPRFGHLVEQVLVPRHDGTGTLASRRGALTLLASYHPSRQNTQTGKLTRRMWLAVFRRARQLA